MTNNQWTRPAGDFAVRIDASSVDPNTWWRDKQLTVEHGTRAMIFQAGVYRGEVAEGRYDMGGFVSKLNNFLVNQGMVAILVDAGDVTLDLENGGLRSRDGFEVGVRLRLVLRAVDPDALFVNMMKGSSVVRLSDPGGDDDLENQLADEAQMVLKAIVASHIAEELFSSLALRYEFETTLRDHLHGTLSRLGLSLVQLRFLDFEGERYSQLLRSKSELSILQQEQDVKLEQLRQEKRHQQSAAKDDLTFGQGDGDIKLERSRQEKRFQQATAKDDLSFAQDAAELTVERSKLAKRLREVMTQEKIDTFKDENDLEIFVRKTEHDLGLSDVIQQDEMDRLKERFQFERGREGLIRRIEIDGIAISEKRKQAFEQLQADERERDERQRGDLQRRLQSAASDVDRRTLELELGRLDHAEQMRRAETALQFKRLERDEEMRRAGQDHDLAEKKSQSAMERLRQIKQMEADEDSRAQKLEAEKLAARSSASAAALISIMDGGSADKIVDLERLRMQANLSPEQMLAMAAQASPDAARTLSAKYQHDGSISSHRAQLLEDQLAEQRRREKENEERSDRIADKAAERMERILQTSLGQMGQVATSRAQSPQSAQQTVVTGGFGQHPLVINSASPHSTATCRFCGIAMEPAAKFCLSCGKRQ